jgi:tetratricopeptide (TPR) repeat protein
LVAAYIDGRLSGDKAMRTEEHLASCSDCYEILADTLHFQLEEENRVEAPEVAPAKAEPVVVEPAPLPVRPPMPPGAFPVPRPPGPLPFYKRRAFKIAAGLATAACLVLTVSVRLLHSPLGRVDPLVVELGKALDSQRLFQPRVTSFLYGPQSVTRSGATRVGLNGQEPRVLAAVAKIRERGESDRSPEAQGAVGITYLVSGDIDAAVGALESAATQAPGNPRLLSDLSAGYLVRAKKTRQPADANLALEATNKAIALKGAPDEAWFNRALAFEELRMTEAAQKAWEEYLGRDGSSGWATEARQHLQALRTISPLSLKEQENRPRRTLRWGCLEVAPLAAVLRRQRA